MKPQFFKPAIILLIIALLGIGLIQCNRVKNDTYMQILRSINEYKVIDAHEHQHRPGEFGEHKFNFFHLLAVSYLASDVRSAGIPSLDMNEMDSLNNDRLWDKYGQAIDFTRSTSYYSQFVKGFKELYGMNELYFTKENTRSLSAQIYENYSKYDEWFDRAFKKAGFEIMIVDQYWKPFNCDLDTAHFALAFHINPLVMEAGNKPDKNGQKHELFDQADQDGFKINTLDDYLSFCDHLFKKNIEHHAVCLKNSMAYQRSLDYEDVPYEKAKALFDRRSSSLTPAEKKQIQDFMFHWIIKKSIEYDLPVQIHTGYLAGNGNTLENGKPVKLNNLFLEYPKGRFILFHGGYPWTGEYAALGKMFPNVFLDIVWLPQISRQSAVTSLDEMFDCVPYNKFFWGGDCGLIEESTGSLEFAKEVVSEVLSKRVSRGLLSLEVAEQIAKRLFRENALEVFKLEQKTGKKF
jgi:hypothetical protein